MVTLCILLWPKPGREDALVAYEDRVLAIMADHEGEVLQRIRCTQRGEGDPFEIHVLRFASEESFEGYLRDPRRTALAPERDLVIERAQVLPVDLV